MRNVMLIGGIYHPFEEAAATLAALLAHLHIDSVITSDVDEAVEELASADMFTLYALRWRMLNHEKYVPFRTQWAYELPESHAGRIHDFVEQGGAMLGLHTASICFDTWYEFPQLLGGVWRWDQTFHPPLGRVDVEPVADHPVTKNLAAFQLDDEIYHDLAIAPASTVLLRGRVPDGTWQPISWAHEVGAGRVVYSALGHDGASLSHPDHTQFLTQATHWLMGEEGLMGEEAE
jgi:type 1 glutamine amidotransferase